MNAHQRRLGRNKAKRLAVAMSKETPVSIVRRLEAALFCGHGTTAPRGVAFWGIDPTPYREELSQLVRATVARDVTGK